MCVHLPFSYRKATQALNYFSVQNGGQIDLLRALKLIFFADRYHVRKYGRPITGDDYFAMGKGPVPSATKDIAENSDYMGDEARLYSERYIAQPAKGKINSRAQVDTEELSATDLEALKFAWQHFGRTYDIVAVSHQYPEWKRHETALTSASRSRMDFMDFLDDPPQGIEPCHILNDSERACRREQLKDLSAIEALWN